MQAANFDLLLDKGWKFHLGEVKRFAGFTHDTLYGTAKAGGNLGHTQTFTEENDWQDVRMPHDWLTALPYDKEAPASHGFKRRGTGWYYITFPLDATPIACARLVFEGVLGAATVYVNGTVAARNFSGYNRFTCEIAPYLKAEAENMIALHVDGTEWEAWSYEGAGLYRPVFIEFREKTHFCTDDCFVRGEEKDGTWRVLADIGTKNAEDGVTLSASLTDPDGMVIAKAERPAGAMADICFTVPHAALWSPETPLLYRFQCVLQRDGRVLDRFSAAVGLRSIVWDTNEGMLLNGKRYRVKGICGHQDHGGVGAAVTPALMEYRILRLKRLGINAYRCAHHAVPAVFLEICDRLGMLVMVENRHYSISEDTKKQLEALVRVARNHPAVFIYSLFNEEPWQKDRRGYLMAKQMREWVRALDDTRATTGAMNDGATNEPNASDALDVIGLNYCLKRYDAIRERTPTKAILGTENCPTLATRGELATDAARQVFDGYGEVSPAFSETMEEIMLRAESTPYMAGCFVWSGFDSYGEPHPHLWPSICSHWGMMDLCGFEKDTAHLLAAWYKDEICVHLLPHWNHKSGQTVRVMAFTNADTAELFLNGRSLGTVMVQNRRAEWQVPFEAGTLRVCARRGKNELCDEVCTAAAPARVLLENVTPAEDGKTRIVNICVTDTSGTPAPDFDGMARLLTRGPRVIGVCNGDPNGLQPLSGDTVPLFHARAQVLLTADEGTLTVRLDGLPEAFITL